jgi:hypothetical protein
LLEINSSLLTFSLHVEEDGYCCCVAFLQEFVLATIASQTTSVNDSEEDEPSGLIFLLQLPGHTVAAAADLSTADLSTAVPSGESRSESLTLTFSLADILDSFSVRELTAPADTETLADQPAPLEGSSNPLAAAAATAPTARKLLDARADKYTKKNQLSGVTVNTNEFLELLDEEEKPLSGEPPSPAKVSCCRVQQKGSLLLLLAQCAQFLAPTSCTPGQSMEAHQPM